MIKRVEGGDDQARLATLVEEVERDGAPIVIERQGTAVAVLVSVEQFQRAQERGAGDASRGALDLVGLWGDVGDEVIDEMVDHIYAERERDYGRPVDLTP